MESPISFEIAPSIFCNSVSASYFKNETRTSFVKPLSFVESAYVSPSVRVMSNPSQFDSWLYKKMLFKRFNHFYKSFTAGFQLKSNLFHFFLIAFQRETICVSFKKWLLFVRITLEIISVKYQHETESSL